jgi:hypothetical protein
MWPCSSAPPMPMLVYQLEIFNQTEVISIEATIAEKHTTMIDKPTRHCKVYEKNEEGFNICSKNFFATFLKDKINCTVPGKKRFLPEMSIKYQNKNVC